MKHRIVLLGPPASGKGSQAQMISRQHGIPAVSTGHLLRDEARAGTELGRQAASFTSKGQLAPDELVLAVLQEWLDGGKDSFVFDGFPRTLAQAEKLEPLLAGLNTPLDLVLLLDCTLEVIRERILHRVQCMGCKSIYHVGLHVEADTTACPECGGMLMRRSDDTLEVLEQRMEQYARKTAPLIEFYEHRQLLRRIDAGRPAEIVFADIESALLA